MRALITGIHGFVGRHLAASLRERGASVCGLARPTSTVGLSPADARVFVGDLLDASFTERSVAASRPTHVFHLAGSLGREGVSTADMYRTNVIGLVLLFEAIRRSVPDAWILVASSGAVYGAAEQLPITEQAPIRPLTGYGASKASAEMVALHYQATFGANVVRTRTFNLLGPGLSTQLFAGSVAKQIVEAERGGPVTLRAGNLEPRRDYVDVRDAVNAYLMLTDKTSAVGQVYNVCAGEAHSCREIADTLMSHARVAVTLSRDEVRVRQTEIAEQRGSPARLREATGWSPQVSLLTSLKDLLEAQRLVAEPNV